MQKKTHSLVIGNFDSPQKLQTSFLWLEALMMQMVRYHATFSPFSYAPQERRNHVGYQSVFKIKKTGQIEHHFTDCHIGNTCYHLSER